MSCTFSHATEKEHGGGKLCASLSAPPAPPQAGRICLCEAFQCPPCKSLRMVQGPQPVKLCCSLKEKRKEKKKGGGGLKFYKKTLVCVGLSPGDRFCPLLSHKVDVKVKNQACESATWLTKSLESVCISYAAAAAVSNYILSDLFFFFLAIITPFLHLPSF